MRDRTQQKKWGDETQEEKNGEMRCKTEKKWGDETREKKMASRDSRQKKWGDKT